MIQMEVYDKQYIDLFGIDTIEEWQTGHAIVAEIDATVEEEGGAALRLTTFQSIPSILS